jgi:hypothetical protein
MPDPPVDEVSDTFHDAMNTRVAQTDRDVSSPSRVVAHITFADGVTEQEANDLLNAAKDMTKDSGPKIEDFIVVPLA